jgi:hypothetical protein
MNGANTFFWMAYSVMNNTDSGAAGKKRPIGGAQNVTF